MNNSRRKELKKALDLIAQARDIIENCANDEEDSFNNLPESFQYSERGEAMENMISIMQDAVDELEDIGFQIDDEIINA